MSGLYKIGYGILILIIIGMLLTAIISNIIAMVNSNMGYEQLVFIDQLYIIITSFTIIFTIIIIAVMNMIVKRRVQ